MAAHPNPANTGNPLGQGGNPKAKRKSNVKTQKPAPFTNAPVKGTK